jgi:hypothetical protein
VSPALVPALILWVLMKRDRFEQRDGHWYRGAGGDVIVTRILERAWVPQLAPGTTRYKIIFRLAVFVTMSATWMCRTFSFPSYPIVVHAWIEQTHRVLLGTPASSYMLLGPEDGSWILGINVGDTF